MRISGERLFLRPISIEDTEMVLRWRNSEYIKSFFLHRTDITQEEHIRWLETKVKTGKVCQFIICLHENELPIGSIYIQNIDMVNKQGEYGIFIGDRSLQGRGYGSEASRLLLQYAFERLGLNRIYLRVLASNVRAIRSYEKLGFVMDDSVIEDYVNSGNTDKILRMVLKNYEGNFVGR